MQTCLARARIFGDLDDPASEISQYVKRGAVGLTSPAVQIGPNGMYYGSKKADMELLMSTSAPKEMPKVSTRRAAFEAVRLAARQHMKDAGMVGLAGVLIAKSLSSEDEKDK